MPLGKSSDKTLKRDIYNYIQRSQPFFSTHPTTENKWCLGINAEDEMTASQLETYLCNIIQGRTIRVYSNKASSQWCDGKYNVVIVTQYTKEDIALFKARFNT